MAALCAEIETIQRELLEEVVERGGQPRQDSPGSPRTSPTLLAEPGESPIEVVTIIQGGDSSSPPAPPTGTAAVLSPGTRDGETKAAAPQPQRLFTKSTRRLNSGGDVAQSPRSPSQQQQQQQQQQRRRSSAKVTPVGALPSPSPRSGGCASVHHNTHTVVETIGSGELGHD